MEKRQDRHLEKAVMKSVKSDPKLGRVEDDPNGMVHAGVRQNDK